MDFCLRKKKTKPTAKTTHAKVTTRKLETTRLNTGCYLSPAGFFDVWQGGQGYNQNSMHCGSVLNLYIKKENFVWGSLYCKDNI